MIPSKKRWTLSDVMGLNETELNQLSDSDLRRAFAPVRDAANKRVRRLEQETEIYSPALSGINKTGGLLYGTTELPDGTIVNKDRTGLIDEIKRGMSFLNYQTSTVKGARQWTKKMEGRLGHANYVGLADLNNVQMGQYWEIMHKLEESKTNLNPEYYDIMKAVIRNSVYSGNTTQEFLNTVPGKSHYYILEHMSESSNPVDRVLSMISAYVDWRAEHGESILSKDDQEDEEDLWTRI